MRDLAQIQRWMQSVVMHPDGVVHVDPEEAEQIVTPSRALSALERLAIYNHAYHARLLECLREEFPILCRALGEEVFDAFAAGYLQRYPSRSYTLTQLGARFPQFLAETAPTGDDAPWPAFLVDLAKLEWTFSTVFDGPGMEGKPLLDAARLLSVSPSSWPEVRLAPVECLHLLTLRYPVQRYYLAVREKKDVPPPEPADTFLAVTRRDFVVRHFSLERTGFVLLRSLCDGRTIAEACAAAAAEGDMDLEQLASQLRSWFHDWTAEGFFCDVLN